MNGSRGVIRPIRRVVVGAVWGWGYNNFGELCLGNRTEYNTPVQLPLRRVTLLSGAGGHSLFYSGGKVYACGNNTYGELGTGSRRSSHVPVQAVNLGTGKVTSLVSAFADSGAVMANGTYYDWGYNGQGARYPVRVASRATSISATAADVMISVRPRPCAAWVC
jgi:alpha-tubulin suppressor-like RCC1 family protein